MSSPAERAVANSGPRPASGLVVDAFGLYRRYPWLFFALAALVLVPYRLIVLAATGLGPLEQGSSGAGVGLLLAAADFSLITPLVSALHIHAVVAIRAGEEPRVGAVARRGVEVLPVVAAASIIAWLGMVLGLFALIVPGIVLFFRWYVAAQAAAIEDEGWLAALRRSRSLTAGNYRHIALLVLLVIAIAYLPGFLVGLGFEDASTDPGSFLVGLAVQIFVWSFAALTTALLYVDLRARRALLFNDAPPPASSSPVATSTVRHDPAVHGWDPRAFSDEERPLGWYVEPDSPRRMRYWGEGDRSGWGRKTIRTPRKVRASFEEAEPGGDPS